MRVILIDGLVAGVSVVFSCVDFATEFLHRSGICAGLVCFTESVEFVQLRNLLVLIVFGRYEQHLGILQPPFHLIGYDHSVITAVLKLDILCYIKLARFSILRKNIRHEDIICPVGPIKGSLQNQSSRQDIRIQGQSIYFFGLIIN